MFEYPYIFWMVALSHATPAFGTALGYAFTALSRTGQPLWVTLPAYAIVHLIGLFLAVAFQLDYDYLEYRTHDSLLWTVIYFGSPASSLVGLAVLLWAGVAKIRLPAIRGFEVMRK